MYPPQHESGLRRTYIPPEYWRALCPALSPLVGPARRFLLLGLSTILWIHLYLYETAAVAASTSSPSLHAPELVLTVLTARTSTELNTYAVDHTHGVLLP